MAVKHITGINAGKIGLRGQATGADLPQTLCLHADLPQTLTGDADADLPQTLTVARPQTYRIPFADLPHTFGWWVFVITFAMTITYANAAYLAYLGPYPDGQDVSEKVFGAQREQSSRSGVKNALGRRTPSQGMQGMRLFLKAFA